MTWGYTWQEGVHASVHFSHSCFGGDFEEEKRGILFKVPRGNTRHTKQYNLGNVQYMDCLQRYELDVGTQGVQECQRL